MRIKKREKISVLEVSGGIEESSTDLHSMFLFAMRSPKAREKCTGRLRIMGELVNKNKNKNNIITPILPTANPGYPISLFFVISDMPPNPAPIISSIVISSYVVIIFEASEILSKDFSYALFSTFTLCCRFANEPSTDLSECRVSIYDLYLCR